MQITLKPELEQYVKQRAVRAGCNNPSDYISQLIEADRQFHANRQQKDPNWSPAEALRKFSEGNTLGDDLTPRDLVNEGRRI